jgi:hypothetical protein
MACVANQCAKGERVTTTGTGRKARILIHAGLVWPFHF